MHSSMTGGAGRKRGRHCGFAFRVNMVDAGGKGAWCRPSSVVPPPLPVAPFPRAHPFRRPSPPVSRSSLPPCSLPSAEDNVAVGRSQRCRRPKTTLPSGEDNARAAMSSRQCRMEEWGGADAEGVGRWRSMLSAVVFGLCLFAHLGGNTAAAPRGGAMMIGRSV